MQKKLILIGSGVVVIIILAVLVSAYYSNNTQPSAATTTTTTNPGNSPAVSPPAFTGEDTLTNIGVTSDQVSNMEQALEQYLGSAGKTPRQVSFNSLQKISVNKNAATPIWTIAFVIQLDNKDAYKAKMDYFNLAGIRLYLSNLDGSKLLYDSQDVGGSPGT
jgi:flagellar basal body-associated protein FliL